MVQKKEKYNKKRGERLKLVLNEKKITQQYFAENMVDFTPQYISDIIRGVRNLSEGNARTFAERLHVRYEYLMCLDDFKTKSDVFKHKLSQISETLLSLDYDKIDRTSKLESVCNEITEIYGYKNEYEMCLEEPFGDKYTFVFYIDDVLSQAISTYFKMNDFENYNNRKEGE